MTEVKGCVGLCLWKSADRADPTIFVVTVGKELFHGQIGQVEELIRQSLSYQGTDGFGLSMGAANRLRHDVVNDAELEEVLRRHFQRGGGILDFLRVVPEDRGAAFRRDDRIYGMFQHQDAVRHA